jgi:murein DD-endopeptidase MepM/ murein hydrolase activator NlpD
MIRPLFPVIALLVLGACTQSPAPVEYRGSYFFGQDGPIGNNGMEAPKYSDNHRADLPDEQEVRYKSPVHDYGVAAEVSDVSASDLPPPAPLQPSPPPVQAVDAYRSGAQATVVDPALTRVPAPGQGYYDYKAQANVPPITQTQTVTQSAPAQPDANAAQTVDYYAQESAQTAAAATGPAPQFIWPLRGEILTPYGGASKGIGISAMKGDPVRAADDGTVLSVGGQGALGMVVTVSHAGGWTSQYGQLGETVVRIGDQVVRGQLVGFVGTPKTGPAQLYFALTKSGSPADPRALMVED